MYLDGSKNELTGRQVLDDKVIDYILKLHNEIRSKIARGRCDQPIAGCMKPLVSCNSFSLLLAHKNLNGSKLEKLLKLLVVLNLISGMGP